MPLTNGFVVVSGLPASGKTTLARQLADELNVPLISKDEIKEAMATAIPVTSIDDSRMIGAASFEVLYAIARELRSGILDANWSPNCALGRLMHLESRFVEVYCTCPPHVRKARFLKRLSTSRHPAHAEHFQDRDELGRDLSSDIYLKPVGIGHLLTVDTNRHLEIPSLARTILEILC